MKECNGAVLNCLKRIRSRAPNSPSGHQGAPISPLLGSLIVHCIIKGFFKLMFHCVIRGPISRNPFSSSGHLPPHSFPIVLLRVCNFPIASSNGQRALDFLLRHQGPQFPHHVIKMMTSLFPTTSSRVPIHHCVIQGPPFSPSRHQRDPNFQNTP